MSELTSLLNKAIKIQNYKGVLVQKTKSGYKVLGVNCKTISDVDLVIEKSCENLSRSISKDEPR